MTMNALQRLDAAGHLIDLIATGIRLRHPQSIRMARISLDDLERVSDEKLVEATERLTAWIAAQPAALTAPKGDRWPG